MANKATAEQIKILQRFDGRGLFTVGCDPYKNKTRMLNRMVEKGLVEHYRHGGYEITDAGREHTLAIAERKRS